MIARVAAGLVWTLGLYWLNREFLRREGLAVSWLGLSLSKAPFFFLGAAFVVPVLCLMAGVLWVLVPFHWEPGVLTGSGLGWRLLEYVGGNCGEELMFRGYLFLALARWMGMGRALLVVSVMFGLFHLPGLSGAAAIAMVCTTALWSILFGLAFAKTGSLWTAMGVHAAGNTVLHRVMGLSGAESLARLHFDAARPSGYDPGLIAVVVGTVPVIICLYRWRGARWMGTGAEG